MMIKNKSNEYWLFEQKCKQILENDEIRFAGIINRMGNLVAGGFKEGILPLENEEDRRKMYMELILRVSMRGDFDHSLGKVKYSASRREKAAVLSFPLGNNVLMVSAEPHIPIDKTADKILKIINA